MRQLYDVAIIGAGASGTLTAIQHARAGSGSCVLIEAGARAARGLAYGTPYGAHLLNVPAGRMSALPDDPEHFLRWLRGRLPDAQPGTFAPRPLYGEYLAEILDETDRRRVTRIGGTAVGLTRDGDSWLVHLHDDRVIQARSVVLALGNLPPADPLQLGPDAPIEYVRDPWVAGAIAGLSPADAVLLIGTGLTAVDVAVAMRHEGHTGLIFMLSRHGRLPQVHAAALPSPLEAIPAAFASPRTALRWVRERVAEVGDWRGVIDGLRPHTASVWGNWSHEQKRAFLRHLRSLWDVHRHRAAPQVLGAVDATILSGRVLALRSVSDGVEVTWRERGGTATSVLSVARVINCTGPASDYARIDVPLVVQIRRAGWLVPDRLQLGIETAPDGALIGSDGNAVDGLFTLGPLRRPALWESTAIPEIRQQAAALVGTLTARGRAEGLGPQQSKSLSS
jgi:uncharacterized NAD(P)/FAD-binding protein YdhS